MNYLAPLPENTVFHDLYEALEARNVRCPDLSFALGMYRREERELIQPALEQAGYSIRALAGDPATGQPLPL